MPCPRGRLAARLSRQHSAGARVTRGSPARRERRHGGLGHTGSGAQRQAAGPGCHAAVPASSTWQVSSSSPAPRHQPQLHVGGGSSSTSIPAAAQTAAALNTYSYHGWFLPGSPSSSSSPEKPPSLGRGTNREGNALSPARLWSTTPAAATNCSSVPGASHPAPDYSCQQQTAPQTTAKAEPARSERAGSTGKHTRSTRPQVTQLPRAASAALGIRQLRLMFPVTSWMSPTQATHFFDRRTQG